MDTQAGTVDAYINNYPPETQKLLEEMRRTIREVLPEATEKISYGIPTFWQKKNIVHFGAFPEHIGFYPGAEPIVTFQDRLRDYETSKGTIRFPIDKPIPYDLVKEITAYSLERLTNNKK